MNDRRIYTGLLQRDFPFFLAHCFRVLGGEGTYAHNWHIDACFHALDLMAQGLNRRLIITMPPRHLKSTTAAIAWPAWMLLHNPALRFITVSYGAELAEKQGRDTLKLLDDPMIRLAFPLFRLTRRSATDFETALGGGRLSTSIGGPLTGRGADHIIVDDPTKAKDATSQAVRESDKAWLLNTLMTRLNDQATGCIAVVMQRLHEDDLAGELKRRGGWQELRLSAIAQEDERIEIGPERFYQRRAGHALHPARQSLAVLAQMRREMGSHNFSAQCLQDPVPATGNIIRADWLKAYHPPTLDLTDGTVVLSFDTGSKDNPHNDFSVGITALVRGKQVYILDVLRERLKFPALKRGVIALARRFSADTILIEDQASGTQLIQSLRAEPRPGVPPPLARRPDGDKLSRALGVSAMIEAGQLFLPTDAPWLAEFRSEILGFPNSRHDDQVDALSQLLTWVRGRGRFDDSGVGLPIIVRAQ